MRKPFTLLELLVAMSVLSVFLLGLMQFYVMTEKVMSSGAERTEMFERARVAMDMMANDLVCVYYSQDDKELIPFLPKASDSESKWFSVSTVRSERLKKTNGKYPSTSILGVKYDWDESKRVLNYYSDTNRDTFNIESASFGKGTELVEGVTNFSIKPVFYRSCALPTSVIIRMELVDKTTLKRMEANSDAADKILENSNRREFRRLVVIDRGQPKS